MLTLLRIVYFISEHGITYVMLSAIWYHGKREKKIHAGVLLLRSLFLQECYTVKVVPNRAKHLIFVSFTRVLLCI